MSLAPGENLKPISQSSQPFRLDIAGRQSFYSYIWFGETFNLFNNKRHSGLYRARTLRYDAVLLIVIYTGYCGKPEGERFHCWNIQAGINTWRKHGKKLLLSSLRNSPNNSVQSKWKKIWQWWSLTTISTERFPQTHSCSVVIKKHNFIIFAKYKLY